jgi:hypothetical protein
MNPIPSRSWNDNPTFLLQEHDDVMVGGILRHPLFPIGFLGGLVPIRYSLRVEPLIALGLGS